LNFSLIFFAYFLWLYKEVKPDAPAWLNADRAYQIATAYFYRYDYARAAELYAAIGQDASSPWRKLAIILHRMWRDETDFRWTAAA